MKEQNAIIFSEKGTLLLTAAALAGALAKETTYQMAARKALNAVAELQYVIRRGDYLNDDE